MLFLLHKYDAIMDYSPQSIAHAIETEKTFFEFFFNVKGVLRQHKPDDEQRWDSLEKQLNADLTSTKKEVHLALCDNFNTPQVMSILSDLVRKCNVYMKEQPHSRAYLLRAIAVYITGMFKVFGLVDDQQIGYLTTEGNSEQQLAPVLDALASFRKQVREAAIAKDTSKLMSYCDQLRNETLPPLGIRLNDDGKSAWDLIGADILQKEVEMKKELENSKKQAKEAQQKKQQEKLEKGRVPPEQLFRDQTDKYSKFDEKGLPTHDNEGNPISKNALKKLAKEYEAQGKLHEAWSKSQVEQSDQ